jgi:hypothetical protein
MARIVLEWNNKEEQQQIIEVLSNIESFNEEDYDEDSEENINESIPLTPP